METMIRRPEQFEVDTPILTYKDKFFIFVDLFKLWYASACFESQSALWDLKDVWHETRSLRRKCIKVNRLTMFYIITLIIYVIQLCFRINSKLLKEFVNIVLKEEDKSHTAIGLGLVAVVILSGYVIGALCPEPWDVCDRQMQ